MNLIKCFRVLCATAVVTLAACGGGDDGGSAAPAVANTGTGTIGSAGGTVATGTGVATAEFPAGALAANTAVTIAASSSAPASTRVVSGTAFDFGPSMTFAQPARVTLKYAPANLPTGSLESRLVMYTAVAGAWQPVAGSTVDTTAHTVSASVTHFSTYAVLANNQFSGSYAGTFNGNAGTSGTWQATVDTGGAIAATATGGFIGTGSVGFNGASTIPLNGSGTSQGITVTFGGTFALQPNGTSVLASGTWSATGVETGTWTGNKNKK